MRKKGIAVAGNMIVDMLYPTYGMPKPGELVTVSDDISRSTGGCLCNDIVDLAKLDPTMPLVAVGRTGDDESGKYIMDKLREHKNIDLSHVKVTGVSSFTLVMADEYSKQRTFYHCRGGNAALCEEDFDWDKLDVEMLHIGYILLLDTLDEEDPQYGTKMAKLLKAAQDHGIKTSIDVVSEASDRFRRLVSPALRYTDYCVINEVEASATTGVTLAGSSRAWETPEDSLWRSHSECCPPHPSAAALLQKCPDRYRYTDSYHHAPFSLIIQYSGLKIHIKIPPPDWEGANEIR